MISSREEFLLLAQNWMKASAKVGILIAFGGEQSTNSLSTAFFLKLSADVKDVNDSASDIVFSVGEDGLLSFGLEGATFNFGTSIDLPASLPPLLAGSEEVDETVTVGLTSGLVVSFLKFK